MVQIVLSIAGPVLEPAKDFDQIGMEIGKSDLKNNLLRLFDHHFIKVGFDLFDDLLDSSRMYPPVVHEPLK